MTITTSTSGQITFAAISGSGLTNLNGLTVSPQYFATSTIGNSFTIVSTGDTHTFNFPYNAWQISQLATTTGNLIVGTSSPTGWTTLAVSGTNGKVLMASSSAPNGLSWETVTASANAGGSDTQIQFNNGGAFLGDTYFTWSSSTDRLALSSSGTQMDIGTSTALSGALLQIATTTNILTVLQSGRIGIGTTTPAGILNVSANSAPLTDMFVVSNQGYPVSASGPSAIQVNYVGGTTASIESSAQRVDFTPGTGAGSTWNAFRIYSTSTATGVTQNAIKIEGINATSSGYDRAIFIGAGWDRGLEINASSTVPTVSITASSSPVSDMFVISNQGYPVNIAGASALQVNYVGGTTSSIESSAYRVDFVPGTGANSVWNAFRIMASSAIAGVFQNAIKIEPLVNDLGFSTALNIGAGWDRALAAQGTPLASTSVAYVRLGPNIIVGGSATGTYIGINQSATTSDFINFQIASSTKFRVNASGTLILGNATSATAFSSSTVLKVCAVKNCAVPITVASSANAVAIFASANGLTSGASIIARGGIQGGAADIGEFIDVVGDENDYNAGDILSVSTSTINSKAVFEKSKTAYDSKLAGMITETAGLVAGGGEDYHGSKIIALAGRAPVKITTKNGPIKVGDYITSSDIPGFGMKATKAGRVLGQAMADFSGDANNATGTVMIFVSQGFYPGPNIKLLFGVESPADDVGKEILTNLINTTSTAASPLSEILIDRLAAGLEVTTPQVITEGLTVDYVSALNDAITFKNDTIFFGRPYFNIDTAGFAIIKQGAKSVDIVFEKEYLEEPVVNTTISLEGQTTNIQDSIFNYGINYLVAQKSVKGFTIVINKSAPEDIKFSWIALAVKNAKVFTSRDANSADSSTPSPSSSGENPPASSTDSTTPTSIDSTITTSTADLTPPSDSTPTDNTTPPVSSDEITTPLDATTPLSDTSAPSSDSNPPADSSPPPTDSPPPADSSPAPQ